MSSKYSFNANKAVLHGIVGKDIGQFIKDGYINHNDIRYDLVDFLIDKSDKKKNDKTDKTDNDKTDNNGKNKAIHEIKKKVIIYI